MRVDAFASQPHYFDHLAPVWAALDSDGTLYVSNGIGRPGVKAAGLPRSDVPTMVAGYPDLRRVKGRPAIFIEHGIGENYGASDPHYSGGAGREAVALFICPNERVAEANRAMYPDTPIVVAGSPRLDFLAQVKTQQGSASAWGSRDSRPLRVVVSFHWDCRMWAWTRTALYHYEAAFADWAADPRIELRGHAHPKIAARARRSFRAAGVRFIDEFKDVITWADVYAVDNSSTLYEAVALGLDVVVLDAPHYPDHDPGAFRFWKYADVGPRISDPGDLVGAAIDANHNRVSYADIRGRAMGEIFAGQQGSAIRAAEAIRETFHDHPGAASSSNTAATQLT